MDNKYYVIVNKETLSYMTTNGFETNDIDEAERFVTEQTARKEIETYDDEIITKYEVYFVEEKITVQRWFQLIEKKYKEQD